MAKPQQPELHRSGLAPTDPGSAKVRAQAPSSKEGDDHPLAPVPEDNNPGHHPAREQDKPVEEFVAKAKALADHEPHEKARAATEESSASKRPGGRPPGQPATSAGSAARSRPTAGPAPTARVTPSQAGRLPGTFRVGQPSQPGPRLADVSVVGVVPPLALLDAWQRRPRVWEETGEERLRWVATIALVPFVGSWQYATRVKPQLDSAEQALRLEGG